MKLIRLKILILKLEMVLRLEKIKEKMIMLKN